MRFHMTYSVSRAAGHPVAATAGPGVMTSSAAAPDRVWSLKELDILQDMTKAIAVIVTGAYEDPHW